MTMQQLQQGNRTSAHCDLSLEASALIVPDKDMSIAGMQKLHAAYPDKKILVLDNNPFNGCSEANEVIQFLVDNRDWFRVVDHHGFLNDRQEVPTLPRLIDRLDEFRSSGFVGKNALAITNFGNLDPDGLFSMMAVTLPDLAKKHADLLCEAAIFTDFTVFGGLTIDSSLSIDQLSDGQKLGLAVLRMITEQKEDLVQRINGQSILTLSPGQIRSVFTSDNPACPAAWDHNAVQEIYFKIINQGFLELLEREDNQIRIDCLAQAAIEHLKAVNAAAKNVTCSYGIDSIYPHGRIAYMSEATGYTRRLDHGHAPVYDWLLESAGQYCLESPVHLRDYRGMLIVSVRHANPNQQRKFDYDLSPIIDKLNQEITRTSGQPAFYGRKEVVLGFRDAQKLPVQKVLEIIDQNWHLIEQPDNPHR